MFELMYTSSVALQIITAGLFPSLVHQIYTCSYKYKYVKLNTVVKISGTCFKQIKENILKQFYQETQEIPQVN